MTSTVPSIVTVTRAVVVGVAALAAAACGDPECAAPSLYIDEIAEAATTDPCSLLDSDCIVEITQTANGSQSHRFVLRSDTCDVVTGATTDLDEADDTFTVARTFGSLGGEDGYEVLVRVTTFEAPGITLTGRINVEGCRGEECFQGDLSLAVTLVE